MTKAFGYIRVSGKGQLDGDGPVRQRLAIEKYAAANNIEIVEWFEEKGVCGATEWEDRPAWAEMIGRLNGVRTIVVESLQRLARELFIQEYILRDLRKREVELLTAHEEDTSEEDPTRVLFRQILGAIAQYDRVMTVRKLKAARDRKRAKEGRCEGRKPYGMHPNHPEELQHLKQMQDLRREGHTFDQIAVMLNVSGVKTRVGSLWYGTTIKRTLAAHQRKVS